MANILVIIEAADDTATPASLQALGQARRLGSGLGATVYSVLPLPKDLPTGDGDLLTVCALRGTDKVVLLADEPPPGPEAAEDIALRAGRALVSACRQLPPTLVFLGDSPANRLIAEALAEQLGALYLPGGAADLIAADPGDAAEDAAPRLVLRDASGQQVQPEGLRMMDGIQEERPRCAVVTLPEGRYALGSGTEAEMMVLSASGVG